MFFVDAVTTVNKQEFHFWNEYSNQAMNALGACGYAPEYEA